MVLAALGPVACAPVVDHHAPELHGTLTRDGAPLADVPVSLAINGAAAGATRTDSAGSFLLPSARTRTWMLLYGDREDAWTLSFQLGPAQTLELDDHGPWGGPDRLDLRCDLHGDLAPPTRIAVEPLGPDRRRVLRSDVKCSFVER